MNSHAVFTFRIPERISPHSTLHKEDPLEYGLIPFPRSDPPTDMAELLVDQICEPKREVGLRRRRRTRTVDVIEFAREQDEETEEPTDLLATIDAEEEGILLVPADYQLSLLEEELPPDECGADVLDIDTLDDESVASGTCKLTLPRKPSPPELERPRPTPPLAPRPLSSMSTASFSSLSLPSSRSSSPSPPATPSSPLPIPYQSQLPRSFHLTGPPFEQSQGIEMSWSTVPPHLMGIFMGAEKEYHRLRSIVESPSLFDEDLYDSDATIRPLTFGRSRSRAGDRRVEQLVT